MRTFPDLLRHTCDIHGSRVAVTAEGGQQTYAELWDRGCRLANALRDMGLSPGDRVAMLSDNSIHTLEQVAGIALAGMVRSPLYTQNTAETNTYLTKLIDVSAILVAQKYAADLIEHLRDTSVKVVVLADTSDQVLPPGAISYESLLDDADATDPGVPIDMDEPHIVRFSAGTTGRPKGIVHTGVGWRSMGEELTSMLPSITPDDAYLAAAPLSHAAGLFMWPVIAAGARHVVMPAFNPEGFLEIVERERVTLTLLVPTMIQMVAETEGGHTRDLSSLRAVFYGASPITETTLRSGIALWGGIMHQLYGQSEALPIAILPADEHDPDGPAAGRLRSAGRATPRTLLTVRGDDDVILPVGEVGEICVQTPGAMSRIWGDDAATAARFTADGALRTRDMGHLDEDGYLYLDSRKEDMIISGGFNVYPAEVENALASHPGVAEAVVVGIPHPKWGETVAAVVALNIGYDTGEQELIEWARERVGHVRKPTAVKICHDGLPRNAVGKISRREVRNSFWPDAPDLNGA